MTETNIDIILKAQDQASKQIAEVNNHLKNLSESSEKSRISFGSMTGAVAAGQLVYQGFTKVASGLFGIFESSVESYKASENATAQLEAVLKSTSNASGLLKQDLIDQAQALQKLTKFSDEDVMSAENLLLTFTNIKGPIMKEAINTTLDMSQALGQDLKSSSIQLGKALQDPILGITALKRVGVNFTEAQKDQIKVLVDSGKTMEAQKVILKELNTEFGGSAVAAGKTYEGQIARIKNQVDDMKESLGKAILDGVAPLVQKFADWAATDQAQAMIKQIVDGIGRMILAMSDWVINVAIPWVQQHWPEIKRVTMAVINEVSLAITGLVNLMKSPGGIVITVGILAAALAALAPASGYVILITVALAQWQDTMNKINEAKRAMDGFPTSKRIQFWVEGVGDTARQLLPYIAAGMTGGVSLLLSKRALGGPVGSGTPYLVGEKGPELFVPNQAGSIIPAGKSGGQSVSINIYGNISTANGTSDIEDLASRIGRMLQNSSVGI